MSDKTVEDRLNAYLDRIEAADAQARKAAEDAAKAEREANFVSKADLESALTALGESLAKQIGEEVAKAVPVVRPEGAGRQGENTTTEEDPFEANPVAHVAKKAAKDRTPEEKKFAWALTRKALAPEQMRVA